MSLSKTGHILSCLRHCCPLRINKISIWEENVNFAGWVGVSYSSVRSAFKYFHIFVPHTHIPNWLAKQILRIVCKYHLTWLYPAFSRRPRQPHYTVTCPVFRAVLLVSCQLVSEATSIHFMLWPRCRLVANVCTDNGLRTINSFPLAHYNVTLYFALIRACQWGRVTKWCHLNCPLCLAEKRLKFMLTPVTLWSVKTNVLTGVKRSLLYCGQTHWASGR